MNEIMSLQYIIENYTSLLAELHRRQAIVRDYVRSVAHQYATGLYLYGRPGTAKTYSVKAVLENEIKEPYIYQRGHLTPMGLFELIAAQTDELIVLDDLRPLLKSDVAQQILLSALEHPTTKDRSRIVKYRRQG
jgi:Cdc6-like AAA superfamily ATPase